MIEYYPNNTIASWRWFIPNEQSPFCGVFYDKKGDFDTLKGKPFLGVGNDANNEPVIELINPPQVKIKMGYKDFSNNQIVKQIFYNPIFTDTISWVPLDEHKFIKGHEYKIYFYILDTINKVFLYQDALMPGGVGISAFTIGAATADFGMQYAQKGDIRNVNLISTASSLILKNPVGSAYIGGKYSFTYNHGFEIKNDDEALKSTIIMGAANKLGNIGTDAMYLNVMKGNAGSLFQAYMSAASNAVTTQSGAVINDATGGENPSVNADDNDWYQGAYGSTPAPECESDPK